MKPRLNWFGKSNDGIKAMQKAEAYLAGALDKKLLALVKLRASQINGCAYCLHMHSEEARAAGEREERMILLDAWHESPLYSERERAALAWTEALTLVSHGVSDELYADVSAEFSEKELAYLSTAIAAINVWNRLGAPYRWAPPARKQAPQAKAS